MVGPGEVDDELEPEIKEECNTKYGDVSKVMIYEIPKTTPEEAVRIFVEFKRVESAIKGKKIKCLHSSYNTSKYIPKVVPRSIEIMKTPTSLGRKATVVLVERPRWFLLAIFMTFFTG